MEEPRGEAAAEVEAGGEGAEGGQDDGVGPDEEGGVAEAGAGGVAEGGGGVEVAEEGDGTFRPREGGVVAVGGDNSLPRPVWEDFDGEMGEVAGEGGVVVAGEEGDGGEAGPAEDGLFDDGALGGAGVGRVDEVAEEDEAQGLEALQEVVEGVRGGSGRERTEAEAAALGPGVGEVEVGGEEGAVGGAPEGAGGGGVEAGEDFNGSSHHRRG